jgi:3-hydroxyacyl-CoA dehydrogenase
MSVAVVGAGSIGVAFALVFARAGYEVCCWDPVPGAAERARVDLATRAEALHDHGLLEDPHATLASLTFTHELGAAVRDADLVQECAPEDRAVKQALYDDLARLTGSETVLASSSSAMIASSIGEGNPATDRILVGHPANPPYLLPIIEIVPSPVTRPQIVDRTAAVYAGSGLHPVRLSRQVEGFVFNRLQGAVLREAYCLVRDGVASVADIDAVVRLGLGRRWGVVGPFETVDLNTRGGIGVHAERMGPAYARMGADRGQDDPWTPDLVAEVVRQRREVMPLEEWDDRVLARDERLMELAVCDTQELPGVDFVRHAAQAPAKTSSLDRP